MNKFGILATLQARPGKESEVERFLQSASPLVEAETGTTTWFAFKQLPKGVAVLRFLDAMLPGDDCETVFDQR